MVSIDISNPANERVDNRTCKTSFLYLITVLNAIDYHQQMPQDGLRGWARALKEGIPAPYCNCILTVQNNSKTGKIQRKFQENQRFWTAQTFIAKFLAAKWHKELFEKTNPVQKRLWTIWRHWFEYITEADSVQDPTPQAAKSAIWTA